MYKAYTYVTSYCILYEQVWYRLQLSSAVVRRSGVVIVTCWCSKMSSFVRRTAARLSSTSGPAASAAAQRKGSDLHPIMEDYGSVGRETDGSRSGGLSTSATFTTDDGDDSGDCRTSSARAAVAAGHIQMHDFKGVQHRSLRVCLFFCRMVALALSMLRPLCVPSAK